MLSGTHIPFEQKARIYINLPYVLFSQRNARQHVAVHLHRYFDMEALATEAEAQSHDHKNKCCRTAFYSFGTYQKRLHGTAFTVFLDMAEWTQTCLTSAFPIAFLLIFLADWYMEFRPKVYGIFFRRRHSKKCVQVPLLPFTGNYGILYAGLDSEFLRDDPYTGGYQNCWTTNAIRTSIVESRVLGLSKTWGVEEFYVWLAWIERRGYGRLYHVC